MLKIATATRLPTSPTVADRATAYAVEPAPAPTSAETIEAQQQAIVGAPAGSLPAGTSTSSLTSTETTALLDAQQGTLVTQQNVLVGQRLASGSQATEPSQENVIAAITSVSSRDRLVRAIEYAHDLWRLQAHFQNITINGMTALGSPGCLTGPDFRPWFRSHPEIATVDGLELELCEAVADGVWSCFHDWQSRVTVPGLPWYPMFAAFPGPMAPPTPNVPTPLITCVSSSFSRITSGIELRQAIMNAMPTSLRVPDVENMVQTLGQTLALRFTTWTVSQQVMLVMGMGPVPTFNPPYVPVGPVMMGYIIPSPGHLAV